MSVKNDVNCKTYVSIKFSLVTNFSSGFRSMIEQHKTSIRNKKTIKVLPAVGYDGFFDDLIQN